MDLDTGGKYSRKKTEKARKLVPVPVLIKIVILLTKMDKISSMVIYF